MSLRFGSYPTPLWPVPRSEAGARELWVKDDGQTSPVYGGNKVRKLERLLALAARRGARRVITFGAAGSHHALACAIYAREVGLEATALLVPQPWTPHAESVLRAGLATGLHIVPCRSTWSMLRMLRTLHRPGDFIIAPGGMGLEGTSAYMGALLELREQASARGLRSVDAIFVAAGSGSTAAGLLAGVVAAGLSTRVVAVQVARGSALRALIVAQAARALWHERRSFDVVRLHRALHIERAYVGDGYGRPHAEGERATSLARSFGLSLDPTYTAKAFAAALRAITQTGCSERAGKLGLSGAQTYLYWHTLSSAPVTALIERAPAPLPPELVELLPKPRLGAGANAVG